MSDIICYDKDGNVIENLRQWDVDIAVTLDNIATNPLPEVHFCNRYSAGTIVKTPTIVDGRLRVCIPDALLKEHEVIIGYIYIDGRTVDAIRLPVYPRPRPAGPDYFVDTSNGTATSSDILSGKIAYVKGDSIEGSIPLLGTQTITPGTSNQKVSAGNYLSGDLIVYGDSDLVAANIKSGIDIFGVKGTFTSDANAKATDMLSGKTAYVNGSLVTGSIPSVNAATITPGTSNQTISAGSYIAGAQTISGDSDLVAGNIKNGVSIFGVTGTYTSGATATASDIIAGKTAYANGSLITGTLSWDMCYISNSTPPSSLGSDGDICIVSG